MNPAALFLFDLLQFDQCRVKHRDIGFAACPRDAERHDRLAIGLRDRCHFAIAVAHIGDIGQFYGMPGGQPDIDLRQIECRMRIAQHAHRLA